jgi:hypothetical protein
VPKTRPAVPRTRPARPAPVSPVSPASPAGRSASTVGYLLRETDREVQRLTRRRDQLVAALGDAGDHVEMQKVGQELGEVSEELDQAEERWLSLAEEAEQR